MYLILERSKFLLLLDDHKARGGAELQVLFKYFIAGAAARITAATLMAPIGLWFPPCKFSLLAAAFNQLATWIADSIEWLIINISCTVIY